MEVLDKINKALDCEEYMKCNECPYVKFGECKILLIRDVRELLQYQEKKIDCLLEKSASLRENIEILKDEQQIVRCYDCKYGYGLPGRKQVICTRFEDRNVHESSSSCKHAESIIRDNGKDE